MKTFDELILNAQVALDQAIKWRESSLATVKFIHARAQQEARTALTEQESAEVKGAMEAHTKAESQVREAEGNLQQLKDAKAREDANDQALAQRSANPKTEAVAVKPAYDRVARVGAEERTYHKGNARGGGPFIRDVVNQFLYRDLQAEQRLLRHMQEERVERGQYLERAAGDATTSAFAGLTVPQYLTELYAPAVAARRPLADAMTKLPLPPNGMTVNISRITTATSAALQSSELSAVSATSIDDTLLTENVQTAAGQQLLSRQALDRGTGVEDVVMMDLQRRYATVLDSTIINQATSGLLAVATDVAYTDTTPTGAELYPKLLAAASASETALLGQADPNLVVMHPRRWYWLQSQLTSTWPLIGQPGIPTQNIGVNYAATYGQGFAGVLPNGMPVIKDANMPTNLGAGTNEDSIVVLPTDESFLWEDANAPQFIRAEQPSAASLGVLLVLYGYFAYTLRRYSNSHQEITGTGLVTPAF